MYKVKKVLVNKLKDLDFNFDFELNGIKSLDRCDIVNNICIVSFDPIYKYLKKTFDNCIINSVDNDEIKLKINSYEELYKSEYLNMTIQKLCRLIYLHEKCDFRIIYGQIIGLKARYENTSINDNEIFYIDDNDNEIFDIVEKICLDNEKLSEYPDDDQIVKYITENNSADKNTEQILNQSNSIRSMLVFGAGLGLVSGFISCITNGLNVYSI
jgi:hypothetical protein